jgi:head-tail adaptor
MKFERMDRRIELVAYQTSVDAYGQVSPALAAAAYSTTWADVVYAGKAGEKLSGHQLYSTADAVFLIRHPRGAFTVDSADVIRYDSKIWAVQGTEEIGRLDGLKIYAKLLEDA